MTTTKLYLGGKAPEAVDLRVPVDRLQRFLERHPAAAGSTYRRIDPAWLDTTLKALERPCSKPKDHGFLVMAIDEQTPGQVVVWGTFRGGVMNRTLTINLRDINERGYHAEPEVIDSHDE